MAKPPRSRLGRLARLGAVTGRVGANYVGGKLKAAFQDEELRARALERLHLDNAEAVVDSLSRLKGAAMKVGQSMAIAAEALDLPEDVAAVFGKLHNQAEPVSPDDIVRTIERELDAPLDEVFATFERQPLGTASLAQAHRATTADGRDVVVKVLHDGIDRSVGADLSALKTALVGARVLRRPKEEIDAIFDEIRARLDEELDYLQEAANIAEFGRLFGRNPDVHIPTVDPARSTERVLTMERIPGVRIEEFVQHASPEARDRAGRTVADLYYRQVFQHRTLHADPHPGNYLFEPDGRVGLVDFGCVKRFDEHFVAAYARTALAAMSGDREACLSGARDCGVLVGDSPEAADALWEYCRLLISPFRDGPWTAGGEADLLVPLAKAFRPMVTMTDIRFESTLVFLHRALGGNYSLLKQLVVTEDWGAYLQRYGSHAIAVAEGRVRDGARL
jgi:predicted unusual protein kinase regulating ubiquinone biosynthesis (AarF/ABC1/UbiB family)